jgi:hypothetical protein
MGVHHQVRPVFTARCDDSGGLTGVTPLMLYRNLIAETAKMFGSPLP